jgi:hypothetical protein
VLKENDVYEVERILDVREDPVSGREFLIKWRGWAKKWNNWEPESHILDRRMINRFFHKRNRYTAGQDSVGTQDQHPLDQPPVTQQPPTRRRRSIRSVAHEAAKKARRAANADDESSGESEDGDHDGVHAIN